MYLFPFGYQSNVSLSIWQNAAEESEAVMDDWNYVEESSLNDMIRVHNELFGSTDIYQSVSMQCYLYGSSLYVLEGRFKLDKVSV